MIPMASIKCYHCQSTHTSVAEVRACAQGAPPAASAIVPPFRSRTIALTAFGEKPITDKQIKFLESLLAKKVHNFPAVDVPNLARGFASKMIEALIQCADKPQETTISSRPSGTQLPNVPAGHYAVAANDDNPEHDIRFYRVDRPTEGRWAGRTFVKVRSSDEWHRIGRQETERVLLEVAMDPKAAGERYANELGRCYRCNRTLTDATSRAAGLGPDCRTK